MNAREAVEEAFFRATNQAASTPLSDQTEWVREAIALDVGVFLAALKEAGKAVVDVEPTEDMIAAATMDGLRSARNGDSIDKQVSIVWSAMIEAAQEQEEG